MRCFYFYSFNVLFSFLFLIIGDEVSLPRIEVSFFLRGNTRRGVERKEGCTKLTVLQEMSPSLDL